MTMPIRLAAAAVIGALAVGGAFYLTRPDRPAIGGPSPEPSASRPNRVQPAHGQSQPDCRPGTGARMDGHRGDDRGSTAQTAAAAGRPGARGRRPDRLRRDVILLTQPSCTTRRCRRGARPGRCSAPATVTRRPSSRMERCSWLVAPARGGGIVAPRPRSTTRRAGPGLRLGTCSCPADGTPPRCSPMARSSSWVATTAQRAPSCTTRPAGPGRRPATWPQTRVGPRRHAAGWPGPRHGRRVERRRRGLLGRAVRPEHRVVDGRREPGGREQSRRQRSCADGRVLVAGGQAPTAHRSTPPRSTTRSSGSWTATGSTGRGRDPRRCTTTCCPTGRSSSRRWHRQRWLGLGEAVRPRSTGIWTWGLDMDTPRDGCPTALLPSGQVRRRGWAQRDRWISSPSASAELFDPGSP